MRIGLAGSSSTGKTTIAELLSDILNLPLIKEGVREYITAKGFLAPNRMSLSDKKEMVEHLLTERIKIETETPVFVSDRTSIDNLAYALNNIGDFKEYESWFEDIYMKAINNANNYDLIIIFPWNVITYVDDDIRTVNKWYQLKTQLIIEGLIYQQKYPFHVLQSMSIKDRIIEIQSILPDFLK